MTRGAHACPAELELVSPGSEKWLNRLDTALQEGQVTGPAFCRDRGWEGRQLPLAPPPRGSDSPPLYPLVPLPLGCASVPSRALSPRTVLCFRNAVKEAQRLCVPRDTFTRCFCAQPLLGSGTLQLKPTKQTTVALKPVATVYVALTAVSRQR